MDIARQAIRYRYLILTAGAAGGAAWLIWFLQRVYQQDFYISLFGGWAMLGWAPNYHHSGLHLYSTNPNIQVGPLALAAIGALGKLPGTETGRFVVVALTFVLALVTLRAVERTALAVGVTARRAAATVLLAGPFLIGAFALIALYSHLEDALAITGTALAVAAIANRRPWWIPALLLGAAVLCKPWAIVGLPLLLQLDSRDRARGFGVAAAVAFLPWLPFVIAAPDTVSELGTIGNYVMPHSVLGALGFTVNSGAPTGIRTLEMLLGTCFAGLVVLRGRWLAAPLAAVAGRMLLEPRWFFYYGASALAAALLWDLAQRRRFPMWTVWTLVAEFAVQEWTPHMVGAVAQLLFVLSVVFLVVLARPVRTTAPIETEERQPVLV